MSDASLADRLAFHRNALQIILLPFSFILPLLLLASASVTQAATILPDNCAYSLGAPTSSTPTTGREHAMAIGLDGIDCITAYEVEEEPTQVCDNSPNPWNDPDEISLPGEAKAVIPSRNDHVFSSFTLPSFSFLLSGLRSPVSGFPESLPYKFCLDDHIRERAPPSLV